MYAARNGHLDCVKYLVECGVEINKLGEYLAACTPDSLLTAITRQW
jgi:hypothetical protein